MNGFRTVFAAAAILFVSSFAVAQDAASPSWEEVLAQGGVKVVTKTARGDRTSYTLEAASGRFTLDAAGTVSAETAKALLSLRSALSGWKSLVPGSVAFTALGDDVRARVVPATFAEGSRDFLPYVPSGLVFSAMGGFVDYEFRVKVDAYFLRFRGRFAGERELLDRLVSAIDDPAGFVKNNDPDYHMARTIEQEEVIIALTARIDELEKRLTAKDALLETSAIANQAKSAAKPVDPKIIAAVADLRAKNPKMLAKDMVVQLKTQGITANVKQVSAVLASLFGEY
jgi:hypothetical protein